MDPMTVANNLFWLAIAAFVITPVFCVVVALVATCGDAEDERDRY